MRRNLLLLLLLFLSKVVYSQSVLWEKKYDIYDMDYADAIVPMPQSSNYLFTGSLCKFGIDCSYRGLYVGKLLSNGDTAWVKNLNIITSEAASITQDRDGVHYWIVAQEGAFDYQQHLLKLDSNGVVLAHYTHMYMVGNNGNVVSNCRGKSMNNGDLLVVGQTTFSSTPNMAWDAYVGRYRGNGDLVWAKSFNLGYYTEGYYVEGMANGHYWVSGSVNSSIWGMELDTSGNVVRQHIFYTRPTYAKIYAGYVQQFVNQQYIVTMGNIGSPTKKFYVGLYDKNYVKKWGHEELGGIQLPHITSDSSVVIAGAQVPPNGTVSKALLRKISIDSSIVWNNYYTSVYNNTAVVSNITFTGDGDAVFAGYIDSPSPAFYDLYFMKVGGIGLPYLPETDSSWLVTSSKPIIGNSSKVSIYPNPAREVLNISFADYVKTGSLELCNSVGQRLKSVTLSETNLLMLSVADLPEGIYHLRLVQDGKAPQYQQIRLIK
ncbi:Por secretion system C-terminal sorting domain-containing protein [Flexibacter flexilis DSM 6793]|uniref:Por secretion system C-terminal sorting domain-containing protein n=1 Tax=Flexibacter flexilis DSM 6793 TaxID=927664 RepID=A0A1I1M2G2_9BACT|nr:T9SS type A sorting domain-containing protein [Flexibacter flexilis]SFC79554.1 Por secretion system C-terminal sorting domain-containing protein [Flexibacter flexilis DSM 6793]